MNTVNLAKESKFENRNITLYTITHIVLMVSGDRAKEEIISVLTPESL